jgi:DNA-binding beta-propeller fold protein YncE
VNKKGGARPVAANDMSAVSNLLTRSISQKGATKAFISLLVILTAFYGYLFITRRPAASTVGLILPGRTGAPVFEKIIYGGFGELQFDKPMAVTTANDRIYISDSNNARVQVYDNNGEFLFTFGENGREAGQFLYPYGLAGDRNGNIYVSELYLSRIQVYTADGEYIRDFAKELTDTKVLAGPGDITIVGNTMYITDINQNKILLIDLETEEPINSVGLRYDLLAPNGVAVDEAGYMYVVDTGRQRVVVFNPDGNPVRCINGTATGHGAASVLVNPRGIGLDRAGNIYVASNLTHTVYVFNRAGQQIHTFGGQGDQNEQFMFPNGLHVDSTGRIFITDTSNQRVAIYRTR